MSDTVYWQEGWKGDFQGENILTRATAHENGIMFEQGYPETEVRKEEITDIIGMSWEEVNELVDAVLKMRGDKR